MANPDVVEYIKQAKQHGLTEEQTRNELRNAGWEDHEIDSARNEANSSEPKKSGEIKPQKPHVNMVLIIVLIFIVIIIIAAGFLLLFTKQISSKGMPAFLEPKDCGTDFDCFIA